jgi:NAD(P)-dependent dehydrogenase (short-subunit alcohol dehydrogenase family)
MAATSAPDYARVGVRINVVVPGYTRTAMTIATENALKFGDAIRDFLASIPSDRADDVKDVVNVISFLLAPKRIL